MILIVGSSGSMGLRYQSILRYLDVDFKIYDIKQKIRPTLTQVATNVDGVILATPTDTHFDYIYKFAWQNIPILCEKPLSKNKDELDAIKSFAKNGLNLTMMMQYKMLDDPSSTGDSHYNYFRTGNDGLKWDCLQIIGLARGNVAISNGSPIWDCKLNGKQLSLADMDLAYVNFVKEWLRSPGDDISKLIDIHDKVMAY